MYLRVIHFLLITDSLFFMQNDPDHLVYLSIETLLEGFSILVFTPTKNWAEKLAETISKEVFALGAPPPQGTIKF